MMLAHIALGSNLGNRLEHLLKAADEINRVQGCDVLRMSSVYETDPMGPQDQPDYLNAVCAVSCELGPQRLLTALQSVERSHGRNQRAERWSARPLDLDILLYGKRMVYSDLLQIPHPGLADRSFVLWPLAELDCDMTIPGLGSIDWLMRWCRQFGIRQYRQ